MLTGVTGLTTTWAFELVMELGETDAPLVTMKLKSPASLVPTNLTVKVGVCTPEATLMSPAFPVTGEFSVSALPLNFHWMVYGPEPVKLQDKLRVWPIEMFVLAAGEVKPRPAPRQTRPP